LPDPVLPSTFNVSLLAGLLLAVLGAPFWIFLSRCIPRWFERSFDGESDMIPVVLCRSSKGLELAWILVWCLVCLSVLHCWGISKQGLAAVLLCAGLLTLARIDVQTGLLPDVLTQSFMWAGMLFQLSGGWISLSASVAGAAGGYGLLWTIFTVYKWKTGREGMGYGDFKLAAALGAWLGVMAIPALLLYASVSGALVGMVVQRLGRLPASIAIPFGPFLVAAGMLILFLDHAPRG
jgi:leader peptidase (prepilin peptidase)/N-methyltransferase